MAEKKTHQHKVNRKHPIFTAQQKEAIRQKILDLLKTNPSLYLSDLKDHLVRNYMVAEQTAYMWLRYWSIG